MAEARHNVFKPVWGLFAILVGVLAITAIARFTAAKDQIAWRTDLAAATAESSNSGKPVMLYFTASWCGPCQRMKSETWNHDDVANKLQTYVPVKIDIDQNAAVAEKYQISSVPTLLLLDTQGNVVRSSVGLLAAADFLQWIGPG
jgi:thioredoxin 1